MTLPAFIAALAFAMLIFSCKNKTSSETATTDVTKDSVNVANTCPESTYNKADFQSVLGILYQQQAAEYRALCYQAYNVAKQHIADTLDWYRSHKIAHDTFAIITDLDETALDNSAESAWLIRHDSTPPGASIVSFLDSWQVNGLDGTRSDSVPGSVSFFKWVKKQNIDIYYISNRLKLPATVAATMNVMDGLGFPEAKDERFFLFKSNTGSKEPRRDTVMHYSHHHVILLLGDNLADLNKKFDSYTGPQDRKNKADSLQNRWGIDYIVFPNSVYGDWELALYKNYPNAKSKQSHDSVRVLTLDYTNKQH